MYIFSKLFPEKVNESIFIIPIILLHLLIVLSICPLKASLESKINPKFITKLIRALEIKSSMLFNLDFANNTI